jgi:single-stranded-DNA-specific exonuclease
MTKKRWNLLPPANTGDIVALQATLRIHPVLCNILLQRGINSFDAAKDFFRPQLSQLHSPWLMKDMRKAVERIGQAIALQDGTTAVACVYQFLQTIHPPDLVDFYIPHRYHEGYGISKKGIDYANDHQYTLMIALDCGIKSNALIAYAKDLGIDFIVCDHHLPDDILPPAVAILNPKQKDCPYPYKELSGCGVGFKLITALALQLGITDSVVQE